MPNKNYRAGAREEYACMKRWKARGYSVARSSGSHGIWDVCAVRAGSPVELIQCKLTSSRPTAKKLLEDFRKDPPFLPDDHFHQVLEVRIKGQTEILSVTI